MAGAVVHQCDHACQRTVFACFEDGQNRCDGDKDAEEEFADFGYRVPVEFVAGPNLFRRNHQRNGGYRQQQQVADEVLQFVMAAEYIYGNAGFPDAGHQYGTDDAD